MSSWNVHKHSITPQCLGQWLGMVHFSQLMLMFSQPIATKIFTASDYLHFYFDKLMGVFGGGSKLAKHAFSQVYMFHSLTWCLTLGETKYRPPKKNTESWPWLHRFIDIVCIVYNPYSSLFFILFVQFLLCRCSEKFHEVTSFNFQESICDTTINHGVAICNLLGKSL